MIKWITFFVVVILSLGTAQAQQGCDRPWPMEIPAEPESKEQVLSVQRQVKQYLKEAEAYLECNDAAQQRLPPDAPTTALTLSVLTSQYNNTVDEMHTVGEKFNALVRAFKQTQE